MYWLHSRLVFVCVTWLVDMLDMTHGHDSLICVTYSQLQIGWHRISIFSENFQFSTRCTSILMGFTISTMLFGTDRNPSAESRQVDKVLEIIPRFYATLSAIGCIWNTSPIYMSHVMTHSYVWCDVFMCCAWLIQACESFIRCTRRMHTCDPTLPNNWHNSTQATHSYVCTHSDSSICVIFYDNSLWKCRSIPQIHQIDKPRWRGISRLKIQLRFRLGAQRRRAFSPAAAGRHEDRPQRRRGKGKSMGLSI